MTETKHADELTLLRLLDSELTPDGEQRARDHVIACASCRTLYESLQAEGQILRAALKEQEEALPEHVRPRAELSWLLVAAIALATLAVSTLWRRFVAPVAEGMDTVGVDAPSLLTTVFIRTVLWRGWSDMTKTLFDFGTALVVLLIAITVLHWGWRRLRGQAALFVALMSAMGILWSRSGAEAAVIELEAGSYVLPSGETIDNDLIVAGERVRIEGTVTGDLIVAARLVEVSGEVQGDVLGFAEQIEVTGRVGGNVRTGSRTLEIEGQVARNVTSAGETLRVQPGASVLGSFTGAGREILIEGPVTRDLIAAGQIHEIHARIGGSALLAGEKLTVGTNGAIGGEARFYGSEEPEVSPQAELASPVRFERVEDDHDERSYAGRVWSFACFWAAAFLLGAVVLLLAPEASEEIIAHHLPPWGKTILFGLLGTLVTLSVSILFLITLIGIPVGLSGLFLMGFGLYAAQAFVGAFIGRQILGTPTSVSASLGRLALGLFLIHLVGEVPFLGAVAGFLVTLWGFGAMTLWVVDHLPKATPSAPLVPTEA